MSKIYQGNFQSLCRLAQLFLDTSEAESFEKIFSSSQSVIWSILLKYQEIDVQIQIFTDEN